MTKVLVDSMCCIDGYNIKLQGMPFDVQNGPLPRLPGRKPSGLATAEFSELFSISWRGLVASKTDHKVNGGANSRRKTLQIGEEVLVISTVYPRGNRFRVLGQVMINLYYLPPPSASQTISGGRYHASEDKVGGRIDKDQESLQEQYEEQKSDSCSDVQEGSFHLRSFGPHVLCTTVDIDECVPHSVVLVVTQHSAYVIGWSNTVENNKSSHGSGSSSSREEMNRCYIGMFVCDNAAITLYSTGKMWECH